MKVLVLDVGGTHVKLMATGHREVRMFRSGPAMTAEKMVAGVRAITGDWSHDAVTIGYPGAVVRNHPVAEPHNLALGWVDFDYEAAFGCPVKIINDAAMQALGSYEGGAMLFLGLGTGLGSTLIIDHVLQPMELAHLPYRRGTFEDYVGLRGLNRMGKKRWRQHVADVVGRLAVALQADDVVVGGGNARILTQLPAGCRLGDNAHAFRGGFRLWEEAAGSKPLRVAARPVLATAGRA